MQQRKGRKERERSRSKQNKRRNDIMKRRPSSPTSPSGGFTMVIDGDDDHSGGDENSHGWLFSGLKLFGSSDNDNNNNCISSSNNVDDDLADESNWKLFDFDMNDADDDENMTTNVEEAAASVVSVSEASSASTTTETITSTSKPSSSSSSSSMSVSSSSSSLSSKVSTALHDDSETSRSRNRRHGSAGTMGVIREEEREGIVDDIIIGGSDSCGDGEGCFFGVCTGGDGSGCSAGALGTSSTATSSSAFLSSKSISAQTRRKTSPDSTTSTATTPTNTQFIHDETVVAAKELSHMNLHERNLAYEELHGVASKVNETPEMLEESLIDFQNEVQNQLSSKNSIITKEEKDIYNQAYENDSSYLHQADLLLMFIRADKFDIKASVKRFFTWLYWKHRLFGISKICKDILYDDLDSTTKKKLNSGLFQLLAKRDNCNRAIIIHACAYHVKLFKSTESYMKIAYYLIMSTLRGSIETQQYGFIMILYAMSGLGKNDVMMEFLTPTRNVDTGQLDHDLYINGPKLLFQALPWRIEGVHFCCNSSYMRPLLGVMQVGVGSRLRSRFRVHYGSPLEVEYALQGYGIPSDLLPFTFNCDIKQLQHKKWITRHKAKDNILMTSNSSIEENEKFKGIELPTNSDVLCGKGKPIQKHYGNRTLNDLAELYFNEYNQISSRGQKTILIQEVVYIIQQEYNGRFLKRANSNKNSQDDNHGFWIEVSNEEAIEKVFHTFRTRRELNGLSASSGVSSYSANTNTNDASSSGGSVMNQNSKRQKQNNSDSSISLTVASKEVPSLLERAAERSKSTTNNKHDTTTTMMLPGGVIRM